MGDVVKRASWNNPAKRMKFASWDVISRTERMNQSLEFGWRSLRPNFFETILERDRRPLKTKSPRGPLGH